MMTNRTQTKHSSLKRKIGGILLVFALVIGLLPMTDMTAWAGNTPSSMPNPPEGTAVTRSAWYPSVPTGGDTANQWQIVSGDYRDGQNGASTQTTNASKSVVLRKNILPTKDENIFTIVLKVRTQCSWADLLDATTFRLQNGKSDNSNWVMYFDVNPHVGGNWKRVEVNFMNAPTSVSEDSLPGNYPLLYKKIYYVDTANDGQMFLFYNNPLIGMGDHGGQKQKPSDASIYYVPVGSYMSSYDALHHAAVATEVTDIMGPGVTYVEGSARNARQIPGVSGRTSVSVSGDTLTWYIDDDGTIPVGQDYEIVADTLNGKTVYYREYDLMYDVHLDASDSDFVPGQTYPTNDSAELEYTYDPLPEQGDSDYWDDFETDVFPTTLAFPEPSVKGTLYNLTFKKVDSKTGDPLKGATFALGGNYGAASISGVTANQSSYSLTATSDSDGIVTFENVPWGDYTLTETEAPFGWNKTFTGLTQTLCYTTTPGALDKVGEIYKLKASLIGTNGVISDDPWPEAQLVIKKNVTNYDDILATDDQATAFDISVLDFDPTKVVFLDEDGNAVTGDDITEALKHQDSVSYTVRMKEGTASFTIEETLPSNDLFDYVSMTKSANTDNSDTDGAAAIEGGTGTDATLTLHKGNDVTVTVNNEYRMADIPLLKEDSITGDVLDGAVFALYTSEAADAPSGAETITYNGDTYYKLDELTTPATGAITFEKVPQSVTRSYLIKEVTPPKGYIANDELIPCAFDADGNLTIGARLANASLENGSIVVINSPIYSLPSSGGVGVYLFAFIGMFLLGLSALNVHKRSGKRAL